jgi:hypothetical protein
MAAGLPGLSVVVSTPSAATTADVAALQADPSASGASLSAYNLLSPDPTAPLPVATVAFGVNVATPLPGFLAPPGISSFIAREDALVPIWRVAIMNAVKHELARGGSLAGVAMQLQTANDGPVTAPDLYLAAPDPADFPPTAPAQTLEPSAAADSIRAGLPVWARTAGVEVSDAPGGQRQAAIDLKISSVLLAAVDIQELTGYLAQKQGELNAEGANLGSVVLRVSDLQDLPLVTFAGDATWGQFYLWMSPQARAYANPLFAGDDATATDDDSAALGP